MGCRIALGVIALMVLSPCCLHAEQCEDYSTYFAWIGGEDLYGMDVRCSGGLLYVAYGASSETARGLRIYSLSEPRQPVLLGSVSTTGDSYGQPVSLEVSGSLAFLCSAGVFHVIDISNPSAPALVGTTTGFGSGRIAINGKYAYVANGGLVVVDVGDPAAPEVLGGVSVPGFTSDVEISGNIGCVSIYKEGPGPSLQVLDLSNPAQPVIVSSTPLPPAYGVAMDGDARAYVATGGWNLPVTLYAIDLANLASPQILSHVELSTGTQTIPHGVTYAGGRAYVCADTGLYVVDVSSPGRPVVTAHFDRGNQHIDEVAVSAGYAYAVPPLDVFELRSNTDAPIWDALPFSNLGGSLDVLEGRAYVSGGAAGIHVFNVSGPGSPQYMGAVTPPGIVAGDVAASNGLLVATDGAPGLRVFGVSPSWSPDWPPLEQVGFAILPNPVRSVALGDGYACVLDAQGGFYVVSMSYPMLPVLVGSAYVLGGNLMDVAIRGKWAYVASGSRGIDLFNLNDPHQPLHQGAIDTPGFASAVTVSGRYAYVADGPSGLQIMDLDGGWPTIVGSVATPEYYGQSGSSDVAVVGMTAYVSDGHAGVVVIDVSDPTAPRVVGLVDTPGYAGSVAADRKCVCVTSTGELLTLKPQCGSSTSVPPPVASSNVPRVTLLAPYPNPFNPQVRIPIEVSYPTSIRLSIYDVMGREIACLANAHLPAGRREVVWDGLDARGRRVASGSYLVRLESSGRVESLKLLLVK
jgi:hypothetical protein